MSYTQKGERRNTGRTLFKKGNIPWCAGKKTGVIPWNKGLKGYHLGELHPRWIKDRTKVKNYWLERGNPEYKQWRKKIWVRDNFKCRISNSDCSGKIQAHHILPWRSNLELRYEVSNGITLCFFHHPKKEVDEKRLSPYFQSLI